MDNIFSEVYKYLHFKYKITGYVLLDHNFGV